MGSAVETKKRTPEQQAEYEVALAKQEAKIASVISGVKRKEIPNENLLSHALAQKKEEAKAEKVKEAEGTSKGIFFTSNQMDLIQQEILHELEEENLSFSSPVEYIQSTDGEFLPSIPLFSLTVEDSWSQVTFFRYQQELTNSNNGYISVAQDEQSLLATLEKRKSGDIHIEFVDMQERYPQTRIKLSGVLHEENGRMLYKKDNDIPLHYSSLIRTDQNLVDFLSTVQYGEIKTVTYS